MRSRAARAMEPANGITVQQRQQHSTLTLISHPRHREEVTTVPFIIRCNASLAQCMPAVNK